MTALGLNLNYVLKEIGAVQMRSRRGDQQQRVWVVRNKDKYAVMSQAEIWDAYHVQLAAAKETIPMTIVR